MIKGFYFFDFVEKSFKSVKVYSNIFELLMKDSE